MKVIAMKTNKVQAHSQDATSRIPIQPANHALELELENATLQSNALSNLLLKALSHPNMETVEDDRGNLLCGLDELVTQTQNRLHKAVYGLLPKTTEPCIEGQLN